jgi:NAD+ synthase
MDLCLYAFNHQIPAADVAATLDLKPEQIERVFRDITAKRRGTAYLHMRPLLVDAVSEV